MGKMAEEERRTDAAEDEIGEIPRAQREHVDEMRERDEGEESHVCVGCWLGGVIGVEDRAIDCAIGAFD